MKYVISHVDRQNETWHDVMWIEFPEANPEENNESVLDGIVKHLDSAVTFGYHTYDVARVETQG